MLNLESAAKTLTLERFSLAPYIAQLARSTTLLHSKSTCVVRARYQIQRAPVNDL
jgi:hypothetical protein